MRMELPFIDHGHQGHVIITLEATEEPEILGARQGAARTQAVGRFL